MFVDELTPIFKQLAGHPVSFMGGFLSGVLRLHLNDDPIKSWLSQQLSSQTYTTSTTGTRSSTSGPQSIVID